MSATQRTAGTPGTRYHGDVPHADDHGHSLAAWVTVAIISAGTVVSAIAFPLTSPPLFWAGVAVIVVGMLVGFVWSRSSDDASLPIYTETTPTVTGVEGPTRSSDGTNRP